MAPAGAKMLRHGVSWVSVGGREKAVIFQLTDTHDIYDANIEIEKSILPHATHTNTTQGGRDGIYTPSIGKPVISGIGVSDLKNKAVGVSGAVCQTVSGGKEKPRCRGLAHTTFQGVVFASRK
jgi:hypothetical protein